MSEQVELTARFTDGDLDVIGTIKIGSDEPVRVNWQFSVPDIVPVSVKNKLAGDFVTTTGEENHVGCTLKIKSLSPPQMQAVKSSFITLDLSYGAASGSTGFMADSDTKTVEQLLESARSPTAQGGHISSRSL